MNTIKTIRNCQTEFRFVCSKTWENLEQTETNNIRHCQQCNHNVHYCSTDDETIEHAKAGHCIAREFPECPEMKYVMIGMPSQIVEKSKLTEDEEEALRLRNREVGIDDSIKNTAISDRTCPQCNFPAPSWRITCRVCGFEMGRA